MASKGSGSARTEPKGRATNRRGAATGSRRLLTPGIEWVIAIIVILVILAGIFYFLRDVRATGTHGGSPLDPTAPAVADAFPLSA